VRGVAFEESTNNFEKLSALGLLCVRLSSLGILRSAARDVGAEARSLCSSLDQETEWSVRTGIIEYANLSLFYSDSDCSPILPDSVPIVESLSRLSNR